MLTRLFDGADPFLLSHNGKYYLYCTNEGRADDGFYVYDSEDFSHWEEKGLCLDKKDAVGNSWFWAPEVYRYKGKFYMLYSCEVHLEIAVSDSPLGPFRKLIDRPLRKKEAIDGHLLFDADGNIYLYFVDLEDGNRIFVGKMSEDLTKIETEYKNPLIFAEKRWETVDGRVTEGPFVLCHKGLYYLFYSANNTQCKDYAIGYAVSKSPLGPFVKYEENPILHDPLDLHGTGHHSFMPTRDENRFVCVFHCHNENPEKFNPRQVCLCMSEFEESAGKDDRFIMLFDEPVRPDLC